MKDKYNIEFIWDDEAGVWIATSEEIRGLVLEHASFDALVDKVCAAVPELLEMESGMRRDIEIDWHQP